MGEEAQEAQSRSLEFDLHDRDLNCSCVCLEMQNESELAYMAREGHAAGRVSSVLRPCQGHDMIAESCRKRREGGRHKPHNTAQRRRMQIDGCFSCKSSARRTCGDGADVSGKRGLRIEYRYPVGGKGANYSALGGPGLAFGANATLHCIILCSPMTRSPRWPFSRQGSQSELAQISRRVAGGFTKQPRPRRTRNKL